MNIAIGKAVRYLIIFVVGGFLTKLVDSGLLTQGTLDAWIEATVAVLIALGTYAYTTWLKPWWDSKRKNQ